MSALESTMRLLFFGGVVIGVAGLAGIALNAQGADASGLHPGGALTATGAGLAFVARRRVLYCTHCGLRVGDSWNGSYACQRCGCLTCTLEDPRPRRTRS